MTEKETGNAQPGACVDVLPRCYRLHLMFGSEALAAVAGGEGLHRASRREGACAMKKNKRSSCKRHEKSFLRKSPVLHVLGIMLRVCSVVRMFSAGSGTLF